MAIHNLFGKLIQIIRVEKIGGHASPLSRVNIAVTIPDHHRSTKVNLPFLRKIKQ
jgi:hypothetical protein